MKGRSAARRTSPTKPSVTVAATHPVRKNKSGAKKARYPDIRRDLERQRATILDEVGEVLTNRPDLESFPDVSDQASAEVDQNFSMRIRERERKLLKKIDEALDRMDAEIYGICARCGEDIPYKRLKARPVTTLCIECKTLEEQDERARK